MDLYLNFATNDIDADIFNTVSSSVANSTVNTSTVASSMILGGFAGFMVFFLLSGCRIYSNCKNSRHAGGKPDQIAGAV